MNEELKITVRDYHTNKEGEIKLLNDIFELIQKNLPPEHADDTLKDVLLSTELLNAYLKQYETLKENNTIHFENNFTPCSKYEPEALEKFIEDSKNRIARAQISPEYREIFSQDDFSILGEETIAFLIENLKPNELKEIGIDSIRIKSLKNTGENLINSLKFHTEFDEKSIRF